jgi:hypothetical protein
MATTFGLVATAGAAAQCPGGAWSPQFGSAAQSLASASGGASWSDCMVVFDPDGPGPRPAELYVGGPFATAGGVASSRLAKWNGQSWSAVGNGITGRIQALTVFDFDGPGPQLPKLVAAGPFTIGSAGVAGVGVWDGNTWAPLNTGITSVGTANALLEFDPDGPGPASPGLVLAGSTVFGTFYAAAAFWNGETWAPLGDLQDLFRCAAIYDEDGPGPALPTVFGGVTYPPGLYKWTGHSWDVVGGGLSVRSGVIFCAALKVVDEDGPGPGRPSLLAGGFFNTAGTLSAPGMVRWDGTAYSTIGSFSPQYQVEGFEAIDYTNGAGAPTIYAYSVGGLNSNIIRWRPATQDWVSIAVVQPWFDPGVVRKMGQFVDSGGAPSLYIGGQVQSIDGAPSIGLARYVCAACAANCDWSALSPILNVNDFVCFLNKFAAGDSYANCDGSTAPPILNVADFICFMNKYAAGCP